MGVGGVVCVGVGNHLKGYKKFLSLRDLHGVVLATLAKRTVGAFPQFIEECLTLQEGVEFSIDCGFKYFIIESKTCCKGGKGSWAE